jgi:hypothetical protein
MPTKREREYYRMGFADGSRESRSFVTESELSPLEQKGTIYRPSPKRKRKLSAWNKFVKANSRKKEFRYRDGKLNLKKMGVAFRRKKRR